MAQSNSHDTAQDAAHEEGRRQVIEALRQLIHDIRVGMFTTVATDGTLRSRPMITADRVFDGELWFLTDEKDPKVAEIQAVPQVNLSYERPERNQYVSLSGNATVSSDRAKAELLWDDSFKPWLPRDHDFANLAVIQVVVTCAEYWDAHQNTMVQLGSLVKGMMTGERSQPLEHQKIDWK